MAVELTAAQTTRIKQMGDTARANIQKAIKVFQVLDGDYSHDTQLEESATRKMESLRVYSKEQSTEDTRQEMCNKSEILNESPLAIELALSIADSVKNATGVNYAPTLITQENKIIAIQLENNKTTKLYSLDQITPQLETLCTTTHIEQWGAIDNGTFFSCLSNTSSLHSIAITHSKAEAEAKIQAYIELPKVQAKTKEYTDDPANFIKNIDNEYNDLLTIARTSDKGFDEHVAKETIKRQIIRILADQNQGFIDNIKSNYKNRWSTGGRCTHWLQRGQFEKQGNEFEAEKIATYITDNLRSGDEPSHCCSAGFFSRAPKSTATKNALIKALSSATNSPTLELVALKIPTG